MYRSGGFGVNYWNRAKILANVFGWRVREESRMAFGFFSEATGYNLLMWGVWEKRRSFIHSIDILKITMNYCFKYWNSND